MVVEAVVMMVLAVGDDGEMELVGWRKGGVVMAWCRGGDDVDGGVMHGGRWPENGRNLARKMGGEEESELGARITTTVVNNSIFRAFFKKQRLTGPNFIDWYCNLRNVLSVEDKLPFLEQLIPTMLVPHAGQVLPPDVLATHSTWIKASKKISSLMLMTMDPDIQKNLEQLGAYDMLKELKTLYAQQAEQELLQTVREFHAYKQEKGQSVSSYILKMKSYVDNLERLGHAMTQNLAVSLILVSRRKECDSFVKNYNMHGMGKTVTELHAMLKLHEQTLPKK
ncbi:hypothetical protein Tco_0241136 [Tanacetum coccineum]